MILAPVFLSSFSHVLKIPAPPVGDVSRPSVNACTKISVSCCMCGVRQRDHVRVMAVHAAVGHQPEEMQSMSARTGKGVLQDTIAFQFTIGDGLINPSEVLINDPASSEIKVANFRVPHLSLW